MSLTRGSETLAVEQNSREKSSAEQHNRCWLRNGASLSRRETTNPDLFQRIDLAFRCRDIDISDVLPVNGHNSEEAIAAVEGEGVAYSEKKIDGVLALLMALDRAQRAQAEYTGRLIW